MNDMTKKRLAAVVSAATLAMQTLPITVFAASDNSGEFKIELSDVVIKDGKGTMNLTIKNNPGVNGFQLDFKADSGISFGTLKDMDGTGYVSDPIEDGALWVETSSGKDSEFEGLAIQIEVIVPSGTPDGTYSITVDKDSEFTSISSSAGKAVPFNLLKEAKVTKGETPSEKEKAATPGAPTAKAKDATSVDVTVSDGCEYLYSETAITDFTGKTWTTPKTATETVTGLTTGTTYYFYQRVKETTEKLASDPSPAATVKLEEAKSNDATLKAVNAKVGGVAGTETIDGNVVTVTFPAGTEGKPELAPEATLKDKGATVAVKKEADDLNDTSTIEVTAPDKETKKEYTVKYVVADPVEFSTAATLNIGTDATVGTKLTAAVTHVSPYTAAQLGTVTYSWYVNGTKAADGAEYTVKAEDDGKTIYAVAQTDSKAFKNTVKSNELTAGKKTAAPTTATAALSDDKKSVVVTVTSGNKENLQYYFSNTETTPTDEQFDNSKFSGTSSGEFTPGMTVYWWVRNGATTDTGASQPASGSLKIPNDKANVEKVELNTNLVKVDDKNYTFTYAYGTNIAEYPLTVTLAADSKDATITPPSPVVLVDGENTITITAENGVDKTEIKVTATKAAKPEVKLELVDEEGKYQLNQAFDPAVFNYTVVLPDDATDADVVTAAEKLQATGLTVGKKATGLAAGLNVSDFTVVADGFTYTYTVTFGSTLSSDATLKKLDVAGYLISFNPAVTSYDVVLPAGTKNLPVVSGVANDDRRKSVTTEYSGIVNNSGRASVTVVAQDGTVNTYYVYFYVAAAVNPVTPASTVTTLNSLTPSSGTLSPAFSPAVEDYTLVLPAGSTVVPTVNFLKSDSGETVSVSYAANLNGVTLITVTSPSKTATRTYRIRYSVNGSTVDSGTITVQPTCTTAGTRVYRDTATGQIVRTETISALGHNWDSGVVVTQPTATSTGTRKYTCLRCGEVKYETIPATGVTTYTYYNYSTPVTSRVNYIEPSSNGIDASRTNVAGLPSVDIDRLTSVKFNYKGKGSYTLKWSRVVGVTNYEVYVGKNGDLKKVKDTSSTSVGLKGLKNNTSYDVQIKFMYDGVQHTINGSTFVYYKPAVRAEATSNAVTLRWNPVEGAEKYAIYQVVNGKYKKVAETTKSSVKIGKRKANTEYKYAVRAYVDGSWTGIAKSDVVTIKTSKK